MIRTLLTTTALTALMLGGAAAQSTTTDTTMAPGAQFNGLTEGYMATDMDNLATDLIGMQVYSSAAVDAEHIGDINNLVVTDAGDVQAVVIGVGGFLGIGEKEVAVSMGELDLVTAEDNSERYVLATTREALEAAPAFEWNDGMDTAATPMATDPAMDPAMNTNTETAQAPVDPAVDPMEADETATGAVAPADNAMAPAQPNTMMDPLDRTNLTDFDESQLTAEELIGTNVYSTNDDHIGTIGDLALNEDGSVDAIIIDFGGFLGIGTKPVGVAFEDLDFLADPDNNRSLVLPITRDQMDAAPAFDSETYTAERDTQRVVIGANTQS